MDLLKKFSEIKILVVGDVMIDKYLIGDVRRISPEAPVPVVNLQETKLSAGGAANVAANIACLGGEAYLVGIVGDDEDAKAMPLVLADKGLSSEHLVEISKHPTTLKIRVMAQKQQIARIDQEKFANLTPADEKKIWKRIEPLLARADAIIMSDYNKGLLTENLVGRLITIGKKLGKIIIIDPKGNNYQKYKGADILTPNKHELSQITGIGENVGEIISGGTKLLHVLKLRALLVTRGEEGMTLLQKKHKPIHLPTEARHVYDVTGAGDTVIAALAIGLGAGLSFVESADLANKAAGLVVEEAGTATVDFEKLNRFYKS